mmetsp:Transcript_30097/g.87671  ORF Transcript_30097/g.87671 Transcript_30097/m.87671 type:complete len:231 (-) Transcript_30097:3695-4387(-)
MRSEHGRGSSCVPFACSCPRRDPTGSSRSLTGASARTTSFQQSPGSLPQTWLLSCTRAEKDAGSWSRPSTMPSTKYPGMSALHLSGGVSSDGYTLTEAGSVLRWSPISMVTSLMCLRSRWSRTSSRTRTATSFATAAADPPAAHAALEGSTRSSRRNSRSQFLGRAGWPAERDSAAQSLPPSGPQLSPLLWSSTRRGSGPLAAGLGSARSGVKSSGGGKPVPSRCERQSD